MALRQVDSLQQYLAICCSATRTRSKSLYEDVLIHVTSFFRDPDVFETLKTTRLAGDPEGRSRTRAPIRVWVAGCSTGEEVYSLAIALLELLAGSQAHPIQIFGSDVSETAIEKARAGVYRRQRDARRQRRAPPALLHQGRHRLSHQQDRARSVRVRPA